jgi:hypothetical protein
MQTRRIPHPGVLPGSRLGVETLIYCWLRLSCCARLRQMFKRRFNYAGSKRKLFFSNSKLVPSKEKFELLPPEKLVEEHKDLIEQLYFMFGFSHEMTVSSLFISKPS